APFSGGWTLDAAAAVGQVDEVSALDLHTALLDGSLVSRGWDGGEPRFGMLETIRAYATERLQLSGESDAVRDRHADHYRDLALAAGSELWGRAQSRWLDRLDLEHDNLRVARARFLENERGEELAGMCFAVCPFWMMRGHLLEGETWTAEALRRHEPASPLARARLLFAVG